MKSLQVFIVLALSSSLLFSTVACESDEGTEATGCSADSECDDELACTIDTCNAELGICSSTAKICSDEIGCTVDSCDAATGECTFTAKDCSDDSACTTDSCDANTGLCVYEAKTCDDGDPCTTDSCDATTGECGAVPKDCTDHNLCTTDACDAATGECSSTPKVCDDGKPCTVDSCDGSSGECVFTAVDCDDGKACTVDSCDAADGTCKNVAKVCDDSDPCSIDACVASTGACEYKQKACDDGNPCTQDYCASATGECAVADATDGTACDDGDVETLADQCSAGVCAGTVPVAATPELYRIYEATLVAPSITLNEVAMNEIISAALTAEMTQPNWAFIGLFDPLDMSGDLPSSLTFGEGICDYSDEVATDCGPVADGVTASFDAISYETEGTCSVEDGVATDAPCFQTPVASFELSELIPEQFNVSDLPAVEGYAIGSFAGDDSAEINGLVMAFLPKAVADSTILDIDLGDGPTTLADLVSDLETVEHEGELGWWVRIEFKAAKVAVTPAPVEPAMFWVVTAALEAPTVVFNEVEVNDLISAAIQAELIQPNWAMVGVFDAFDMSGASASSLTFGEGVCNYMDQLLADCSTQPEGTSASFDSVTFVTEGGCSVAEGASVDAPCYETPMATFAIDQLIAGAFEATDLPPVEGYSIGSFADNGARIDGLVMAFLPQDVAQNTTIDIDLGDGPVSLASLVSDLDTVEKDGVTGWWLRISFGADRVQVTP